MELGKVLCDYHGGVVKAIGADIFESTDGGLSWKFLMRVEMGGFTRLVINYLPLLSRLLRLGIHQAASSGDILWIVCNRSILLYEKSNLCARFPLQGSRPLSVCARGTKLFYGEYVSNPERRAIRLIELDARTRLEKVKWKFTNIRHVHGVFYDNHTSSYWITTGDSNEEAAIWRSTDNLVSVHKVYSDGQRSRAINLIFTESWVYFGTDTPEQYNYICRLSRSNYRVEELQEVSGSVFHATYLNGLMFFSTAVEPSVINKSKYCEVWGSANGTNWSLVQMQKKDCAPVKLFQYPQIGFPNFNFVNDHDYLWLSFFSTLSHGKSKKLRLSDLRL